MVKNTLPKGILIKNEPNKNDITSTQSIALVCCFCNALQCNNATIIEAAAGKTDRPAETRLQLQRRWLLKTRLALEKLCDALNLCCRGGLSLWLEILHPMHCNVMEGGKSRRCFKGVIREQLLRLRGRETSDCRVVELSRTHSAHSDTQCTQTWAASAHRTGSSKPTTAFARLLPSAANYHQPL